MDKLIQDYQSLITNKYSVLFLLYFIHLKFFTQIVLDTPSIIMDIALYLLLLLGVNYRRVKLCFFVLIPIVLLCVLNPAATNIFVILISTYIVAQLPFRTILFHNLCAQIIVFLLCTICLYLGITETTVMDATLLDTRVRYDYGMGNPNTFALFVYSFFINLYLYKGNDSKIYLFLIALISWKVYSYTGSRTFLISVVLLLLCCCIRRLCEHWPRLFKFGLLVAPILTYCFIFYFTLNYTLYPEMDLIFSGRLDLYDSLLSSVSLSNYLFGTELINEITIDSSYLHILFEGGILSLLIFFLLYSNLIIKIDSKDLATIFPVLMSVLMFGLTESVLTFVLLYGNMIIWVLMYNVYIKGDTELS